MASLLVFTSAAPAYAAPRQPTAVQAQALNDPCGSVSPYVYRVTYGDVHHLNARANWSNCSGISYGWICLMYESSPGSWYVAYYPQYSCNRSDRPIAVFGTSSGVGGWEVCTIGRWRAVMKIMDAVGDHYYYGPPGYCY
jgi:hypothetical protein